MGKSTILCQRCTSIINRGEKVVGLHTYNEFPKVSDERYFHFNCFIEWKNEKIIEAGMIAQKKAMKNIMPMIKPMVEEMTSQLRTIE